MNYPTFQPGTLQRLSSIVAIKHVFLPATPVSLSLEVTALVNSAGWTNVQLLRREYLPEPADGVWEFDMLAMSPADPADPIVMAVTAKCLWEHIDPSKVNGLRVYGSGTGVKEILLP